MIRSEAVTDRIFSCMRAQHVMSDHLIYKYMGLRIDCLYDSKQFTTQLFPLLKRTYTYNKKVNFNIHILKKCFSAQRMI